MSGFRCNLRKNPLPVSNMTGLPASKRMRIGTSSANDSRPTAAKDDDDDAFADDDITGEELEEWELVASQAEIKLTQEQCKQPPAILIGHKQNGLINGTCFKAPTPRINSYTKNTSSNTPLIKELQEKLSVYEKKLIELEQSYKRKDGETMVLRDRLSTTEKHLNQEKIKMVEMQNRQEQADVERNKFTEREIQKFKDQVQFKQAEILESQNFIKNLAAKNKVLEKRNGETRTPSTSLVTERLSDSEYSGTEDLKHFASKKIRLVKPESPRVSNSSLLCKPDFSDDPLGRKKFVKPSTSSPPKDKDRKLAETPQKLSKKLTLKSNYLSKDLSDRSLARELLSSESHVRIWNKKGEKFPPFLDLLDFDAAEKIKALECLKNLLTIEEDGKVFGNLCRMKRCDVERSRLGNLEILDLLEISLSAYISLQDSASKERMLSQKTPSFHTASSEQPNELQVPMKFSASDAAKICKNAHSVLQVLYTMIVHCQKIATWILNNNQVLLLKVLKICDSERWHPGLDLCENITNEALHVVLEIAKSSKLESHLERFSPFVKADVLRPLLANCSIELKHSTMNVLISVVGYSPFVSTLVKEDAQIGSPSLLCHICDLVCLQQPQDVPVDTWLEFTQKIVTLLSILTAKYESVLAEHSCFCEVYHAADILLYNQLTSWKRDSESNFTRFQLIKSTLCLLHSCANIYCDGIPGSRRDHRHLFTLTILEEFLSKDGNQASSFWSRELSRIVKSEVKAIFEEVEIS